MTKKRGEGRRGSHSQIRSNQIGDADERRLEKEHARVCEVTLFSPLLSIEESLLKGSVLT